MKSLRKLFFGTKKPIYEIGDKLYYLMPEKQKVYSFVVESVVITKSGINYHGCWNGIFGGEYFKPDKTISHHDVHHCKESLIEQFCENLKLVELK